MEVPWFQLPWGHLPKLDLAAKCSRAMGRNPAANPGIMAPRPLCKHPGCSWAEAGHGLYCDGRAAHLALLPWGDAGVGGGVAVAAAAGGTEAASTAITAACADGDCTNEIRTASNAFCARWGLYE